jgi:hypothetical protein
MPQPGARGHPGAKLVIAGAVVAIAGAISETAIVVQLLEYEPPCEPITAWSFTGGCGVLRLLVLLTLPVLLMGFGLFASGLVLRRGARRGGPR